MSWLKKEIGSPKPVDFEIELYQKGMFEKFDSDGDDTVHYSLQAALTSHAYSHQSAPCLRYGDPC